MYKDKEKQKEANAERQRRYRENARALRGQRRGRDITKFEYLPLDVQRTINRLSDTEQEHTNRTAIAINYQHLFPDRYYNTGIALSSHKYSDVVYAKEAVIYNEGKEPRYGV